MSSESKQWLLEVVLMLLALIALASAPGRGASAEPAESLRAAAPAR